MMYTYSFKLSIDKDYQNFECRARSLAGALRVAERLGVDVDRRHVMVWRRIAEPLQFTEGDGDEQVQEHGGSAEGAAE